MAKAIADDLTSALARPQTLADDWPQLGLNSDWQPEQQLGPYRLKRCLGKGGMGVVWLAEQLTPFQRDVAIKVLSDRRRDSLSEAWFEVERQALAQLSHRGIAQIYDAGRLPDCALIFAMEYVPGVPLDDFQTQYALDTRALAALFVQICAAAQHAHQRGLVHRDLKPLNVLVQQLDGGPVAKIIDFGVAIRSLPMNAGPVRSKRIVGTPAYMSPEQKNPGEHGVDARSDIYALGVMLAEALCRQHKPGSQTETIDVSVIPAALSAATPLNPAEADQTTAELRTRLRSSSPELLAIAASAILLAILTGSAMAFHGMTQAQSARALAELRTIIETGSSPQFHVLVNTAQVELCLAGEISANGFE